MIKIEADCTATSTLDHSKTVQQTVSTVSNNNGAVFTDNSVTPLLTTHVFYQHPANLILSSTQSTETTCKSQATSPVTCLTPPPEITPIPAEEENSLTVQDASNQTETHMLEEEELVKMDIPLDMDVKSPLKQSIDVKKVTDLIRIPTPVPEPVETDVEKSEDVEDEDVKMESKPDISGLELLSNSIVEYESCRKLSTDIPIKYEENEKEVKSKRENGDDVLKAIAHMTIKDKEAEATMYAKNMDDNLGGLNLLCALAEQRFVEEVLEKQNEEDYRHYKQYKKPKDVEVKKDNNFPREHSIDNDFKVKPANLCALKGQNSDEDVINLVEAETVQVSEIDLEREKLSVLKRVTGERGIDADKCKKDLNFDFGAMDYDKKKKTERNKFETEKVIKTCSCEDVRNKNYQEKDLSDEEILKINKGSREWSPTFISAVERNMRQKLLDLHRQYKENQLDLSKLSPLQTRECDDCSKRTSKTIEDLERSLSPPILDKAENSPTRSRSSPDIIKPPTLCPLVATNEMKPQKANTAPNMITPMKIEGAVKRKSCSESPDSTPEKISSSKKRKVGRPKKLLSAPGLRVATETIVAKKPKTKNGLVGFLLAAKNRLQMQAKNGLSVSASPPKFIDEKPKHKVKIHHKKKNVLSTNNSDVKKKKHKSSKIRPKLKAETKVKKAIQEEEEECSEWEITMPVAEESQVRNIIIAFVINA